MRSIAQDSPAEAKEAGEEAAEEDPYAVPVDASVEDLFKHITTTMASPPRTLEELKGKYGSVLKAADLILEQSDTDEDYIKAIKHKFGAMSGLARYDRSLTEQVDELADKLANDERTEIAVLGETHKLSSQAAKLRDATEEEAGEVAARVLKFLDRFGMTRQTYRAASSVARSIG